MKQTRTAPRYTPPSGSPVNSTTELNFGTTISPRQVSALNKVDAKHHFKYIVRTPDPSPGVHETAVLSTSVPLTQQFAKPTTCYIAAPCKIITCLLLRLEIPASTETGSTCAHRDLGIPDELASPRQLFNHWSRAPSKMNCDDLVAHLRRYHHLYPGHNSLGDVTKAAATLRRALKRERITRIRSLLPGQNTVVDKIGLKGYK
ncbi:hypothetical protein BU16DRAFT_622758 [Lophium mytilinum]|uniref:Uncharacterized protein n=1 Tax=Lophium mytilinum TaxID=390894 RepID=A0A6A6QAV7_9PEZI|nr:hypothetical protein BU16DRAFT_622758 [Lophium mytilinum]